MADTRDIFNDFLTALQVPHTQEYSARRFGNMPFRSLFGFSKLLADYGVESGGYFIEDKDEFESITPPYLARMSGGSFVIVHRINNGNIEYQTPDGNRSDPLDKFKKKADGMVFLAFPTENAAEPDFPSHHRLSILASAKKWLLLVLVTAIAGYLFVSNGVWRNIGATGSTVISLLGLIVSVLLVMKSHGVHTRAADRVCGVLQEGGCDSILSTGASTFYGLFGWSEVGLAYFSITLIGLLAFSESWSTLAIYNLACLPFSFWSIWYQKFRAKAWCTLCVTVQGCLWLIFAFNLWGGLIKSPFPLGLGFFLPGAIYVTTLLGINALSKYIRFGSDENDDAKADKLN